MMTNFETAINELDLALFEKIPSQSTERDKRSLLACQGAVRGIVSQYRYLEIGSYLGGSIQPHLLDPKCERIYSIDKRPPVQPDARGMDWEYHNNSTARMLQMLSEVAKDTGKIVTIDGETSSLDNSTVGEPVDLCFIDGEHTDAAAAADFRFCRKVLAPNGAIIFHDAHIVYNGIASMIDDLENAGVRFRSYVLPHTVFVIEIGDFPMLDHPSVLQMVLENRHSYLFALQDNDRFRQFANRFPFKLIRKIKQTMTGGNVSE